MSAVHPGVGHYHGGLGGFHGGKVFIMVERRFQLKEIWKIREAHLQKCIVYSGTTQKALDPPALCDIGLWGTLSPKVVFHHWPSVRCEENPRCRWFTYDERAQLCYLKSGRGFQRSRCKQKNMKVNLGLKIWKKTSSIRHCMIMTV